MAVSGMRRASFSILFFVVAAAAVLAATPARAEVTRDSPRVEESGYTLHAHEWKIGLTTSSYGITDRLQVDSALLLDLVVLNAGLKYKLVDAPNLALSVGAFGGFAPLALVLKGGLFFGGARADASVPVAEKIAVHLTGGWNIWSLTSFDAQATQSLGINSGRISWFSLRAIGEWVFQPRHVFFLSVGTPTSWVLSVGKTAHDFDALDFAEAKVGYQYSSGGLNFRFDVGVGPSLLTGLGPVASLDAYYRF